jgi:hypothetical protein
MKINSLKKIETLHVFRDTITLTIANFLSCILAGFVVFAYMGFLSKQTGLEIDRVVQSGIL